MATFTAVKNGNWNDPTVWGFSAGTVTPGTNIPGSGDTGNNGGFDVLLNVDPTAPLGTTLGSSVTLAGTGAFTGHPTVAGSLIVAAGASCNWASSSATINGTLSLYGALNAGGMTFTVAGTMHIYSGGIFDYASCTITISGALQVDAGGTFEDGGRGHSMTGYVTLPAADDVLIGTTYGDPGAPTTGTLCVGGVTITATKSLNLVTGDDYLDTDGRGIQFGVPSVFMDLTGATLTLDICQLKNGLPTGTDVTSITGTLLTGSYTINGVTYTEVMDFQPSATQTALLTSWQPNSYAYRVRANWTTPSAKTVTVVLAGSCSATW